MWIELSLLILALTECIMLYEILLTSNETQRTPTANEVDTLDIMAATIPELAVK